MAIKMDLKSNANSPGYVKSLIFSKKETAILKLLEFLPFVDPSANDELRIIYMKILPVFFSFAELHQIYLQECLTLIRKVQRHPFFKEEKSLFDGWQNRLKNLLQNEESLCKPETRSTENKFFNIRGTNMNDVIGYVELDLFLRYHKWLKFHKLHKYLYFFANLSYVEIESIDDEQTIRNFEDKVDLYPMTEGARKAILRKLAELHQRSSRLEIFSKVEYYTSVSKIEKSIYEMKMIMKTPIRKNRALFCQNNLPDLLCKAVETVVSIVLRLRKNDLMDLYDSTLSLLKMAWGCWFFESEKKNKFNVLQAAIHSKRRSYCRKKIGIPKKDLNNNHIDGKDIYTVHFEIEKGIRAITWYLENVVLKDSSTF